jgi:hypothetical protein
LGSVLFYQCRLCACRHNKKRVEEPAPPGLRQILFKAEYHSVPAKVDTVVEAFWILNPAFCALDSGELNEA